MLNTSGIERKLDILITEMQSLKAILKELLDSQPRCTCYGREDGESWTCAVHGYVTRTKATV